MMESDKSEKARVIDKYSDLADKYSALADKFLSCQERALSAEARADRYRKAAELIRSWIDEESPHDERITQALEALRDEEGVMVECIHCKVDLPSEDDVVVPAEVWERYRKALQRYADRPQGHYTCGCGASYSFMETADVARQALGSEEPRIEDNLLDGEGPD